VTTYPRKMSGFGYEADMILASSVACNSRSSGVSSWYRVSQRNGDNTNATKVLTLSVMRNNDCDIYAIRVDYSFNSWCKLSIR